MPSCEKTVRLPIGLTPRSACSDRYRLRCSPVKSPLNVVEVDLVQQRDDLLDLILADRAGHAVDGQRAIALKLNQ